MVRSSMISVNLERSMNFITVYISISHICTISFLKTFKEEVTVHIEVLVELVKTSYKRVLHVSSRELRRP